MVPVPVELCAAAFAGVAFCVGNHDLWLKRGDGFPDSLAKFAAIERLCAEVGVSCGPTFLGGCVVAPVQAWHHASWDTEAEVVAARESIAARTGPQHFGTARRSKEKRQTNKSLD